MWRIITVDDCIARATTIEQKATSKLGSRMPAPETKLSSGRFPVATCDTETEDNAATEVVYLEDFFGAVYSSPESFRWAFANLDINPEGQSQRLFGIIALSTDAKKYEGMGKYYVLYAETIPQDYDATAISVSANDGGSGYLFIYGGSGSATDGKSPVTDGKFSVTQDSANSLMGVVRNWVAQGIVVSLKPITAGYDTYYFKEDAEQHLAVTTEYPATTDETTTDDTTETTCETNCTCAFPPLLGSGNMLANEYYKNSLLPLEASLDYACARLRTAISQGGFSNMPKGLRKIPLSCFDLVLSLAVYHYASRTLNQELQNQDPRRRAYEQALDDLEKIREGKLLVEDEDSDDVGSTKTAASIAREIGYTPRWQRGNFSHGLW